MLQLFFSSAHAEDVIEQQNHPGAQWTPTAAAAEPTLSTVGSPV